MSEHKKHLAKMFHKKFEAIDASLWHIGSCNVYGPKHCALGHLGASATWDGLTVEAKQLVALLKPLGEVNLINDGEHPDYQQLTPKARILAALEDIIRQ